MLIIIYLLILSYTDVAEDRLDSLLKTLNKDTPLINSNINESNLVDKISKTDGTVLLIYLVYTLYIC